jgi:hypothetical protein
VETGPGPEEARLNYANLAPRHNVLKGISKISKPDPIISKISKPDPIMVSKISKPDPIMGLFRVGQPS